jgi:hypothetical protein
MNIRLIFRDVAHWLASKEVLTLRRVTKGFTFDDYDYPMLLGRKAVNELAKKKTLPPFMLNQVLRRGKILQFDISSKRIISC